MKYSIYTLTHPINNQVFYVGKTIDMKTRFKAHLNLSTADSSFKTQIVRFIQENGAMPIIEELDSFECIYQVDEDYVNELETYWIHQFYVWGFPLCNIAGLKKPQIYKRRYSHILKEGTLSKIMRFLDFNSSKLINFIDRVNADSELTKDEKYDLLHDIGDDFNSKIKDINRSLKIEIPLFNSDTIISYYSRDFKKYYDFKSSTGPYG